MKSTLVILSTLFAASHAGNVCVAGTYKPSKINRGNVMVFAAGAPCDDDRSLTLDQQVGSLCENLPKDINVCGQDAKLVKIRRGPKSVARCQIGLEIDGKTYVGETDTYSPDAGPKDGPCDASCGLTTGIDGFLQFVDVPMCK